MFDFSGKTAIVTGGSRGIGKACAEMLARAGADVAVVYLNETPQFYNIENGGSIFPFQCDLRIENEVNKLTDRLINRLGHIDILINNAGIWKGSDIETMDHNLWKETMSLNLDGLFFLTKQIVPVMKKQNYGKIVNISSTAAQRGEAFYSNYAASKGAVNSFTKSLAAELGPYNINVNAVAPGWVETDMTSDVFRDPAYYDSVRLSIPLKRVANAEDIAGPVMFLTSELARHINGEILNVNGGSVLCG